MTLPPAQELDLDRLPLVSALPAGLWGKGPSDRRSTELTPLFVQRYTGPRQRARLGRHPFWELTFTFRGAGSLTGTEPIALRAGTAVLVPAGWVHGEDAGGMLDTLWIGLRGSRLQQLPADRVHFVSHGEELALLCEQLWLRAQRHWAAVGPELDGLAQAVLGRFLGLLSVAAKDPADFADEVVQYLHRHYARPVSVAALAERWGYSEGYFYRAFRRRVGHTPLEYLTSLRTDHAAQMLAQSTLSIARIAKLVGFEDPQYFSRVFRTARGVSPTEFREQERV